MSKRQEAIFSSSVAEIENLMNKLIEEKKGKASSRLAQILIRSENICIENNGIN